VTGQRNVFQATDAFTPFAFADTPRNVSPILSDLRVDVGKRFDTEFIVNYDAQRQQLKAIGSLVKIKPYKESFLTLENLSTQNLPTDPMPPPPNFEQRSNQVRGLVGYGDLTRRGWNATFGASYDVTQQDFQNQIVQVNYNSSCCGVGVEYRRLSFGTIRNENQFRIVVLIANLGSAGNLRRTEKVF
jgi:LPS-assembly protein